MWWKTVGSQGDNGGAEIQKWKELVGFYGDELGSKAQLKELALRRRNHPKAGEKEMEMKKIEGLWKLKRRETEKLIGVFFCSKVLCLMLKVSQSCPTLYNPMNYTVHGILQARILAWIAVTFSRGSSQLPLCRQILYQLSHWMLR